MDLRQNEWNIVCCSFNEKFTGDKIGCEKSPVTTLQCETETKAKAH